MNVNEEMWCVGYKPLSRGVVIAALYNARSHSPTLMAADIAEAKVHEILGNALAEKGVWPNEEGYIGAIGNVHIGVHLCNGKCLSVRREEYDNVKRIIDGELKRIGGEPVSSDAVEIAMSYVARMKATAKVAMLALLTFGCLNAFALTEVVDGVSWGYRIENGEAILMNRNCSYPHDSNYLREKYAFRGVISIPSILGGCPVAVIDSWTFAGCENIQGIIIPSSVRQINSMAFAGKFLKRYSSVSSSGTSIEHYSYVTQNYYFKGDCPKFVTTSWVWPGPYKCEYMYAGQNGYGIGSFMDSSCVMYYVEGRDGFQALSAQNRCCSAEATIEGSVDSDIGNIEVELSCCNKDAIIFYTIDGSNPTNSETATCFRYTGKVNFNRRVTVKAIASVAKYPYAVITERSFAFGNVEAVNPIIVDGASSACPVVGINCGTDDAVIHYTTNGDPVTEESPVCLGSVTISEATTIRAKAFKKNWFESGEVVRTFIPLGQTDDITSVETLANVVLYGGCQEVVISCAVKGTKIYYTLDGSDPSSENGVLYHGLFKIREPVTIKAIAIVDAEEGGDVELWFNKTGLNKTVNVDGIDWTYTPFLCEDSALFGFTRSACNLGPVIASSYLDEVRIPEFLDGKRVTAIRNMAFTGCNINKLIIPPCIREIDWSSFRNLCFAEADASGVGIGDCVWYPNMYSVVSNVFFEGDLPKFGSPAFNAEIGVSVYNGGMDRPLPCEVWWVSKECKNYVEKVSFVGSYITQYATVKIVPYVVAAPAGGTIISDDVSVVLSCATAGAIIYYTTDGAEPSESSLRYEGMPIRISKSGTIKTLVMSESCPFSKVYSHSYAQGQTESLIVNSTFGCEYYRSNNEIILSCPTKGAIIRYTTDGSVVTESSPIYMGPFTISETTTVRAKAFKEDWFDSEEVVRTFTRVWYTNETPVISAASAVFDGASQEVTISCATEGATVYYTIDGSEPSVANGRVYKGPFNIYDSVAVKAIAVKDDWKDSAVASAAFTKNNGLSAAINMYDYLPDNDANAPWMIDTEVSHDGVTSVRSGAIGDGGVTTMKVTVRGAGRLSFWWKSECEKWCEDYYDYGAFFVGSETVPRLRIAGMTDWKREEIEFDSTGKHVCKWEYHKDDAETIPRDCIWVDQVQWLPYGESEHDHTLTTEVPVPYLWLDSYGLGRETDFEIAAKMKLGKVDGAGRAMSVEDDYIAGTDPTDPNSKFVAEIKIADGKPVVGWSPDLNENGAKNLRKYTIWGKKGLLDAIWTEVPEGRVPEYNFFKVTVGMPESK